MSLLMYPATAAIRIGLHLGQSGRRTPDVLISEDPEAHRCSALDTYDDCLHRPIGEG
jgi:hypothetical protein